MPRLQPMSAEQVALIIRCAECGEVWLPADEDRWRTYLDTDDEPFSFPKPERVRGACLLKMNPG